MDASPVLRPGASPKYDDDHHDDDDDDNNGFGNDDGDCGNDNDDSPTLRPGAFTQISLSSLA